MAYVGTPLDTTNAFQSLAGKRFSGDASTTDFTLDSSPNSTLDIEVFVENVRQDPNSAYTVSGTTLGFTAAPPSGTNNIYVVHQAKSVGTIDVPSSFADSAKVFNESGNDVDFRVESSGNANMLFISGGNDVVGIGAEGDLGAGLHIKTADSGASAQANADELIIEGSGHAGMSILSGTSSTGTIYFGDSGDDDIGKLYYNHSDNSLNFFGNATNFLYMDSSNFVFNEDSNDINFRVESNGNTHMIYSDGGTNHLGLGVTAAAGVFLTIKDGTGIDGDWWINADNVHGTNPNGMILNTSGSANDSTAQKAYAFQDSGTMRFMVYVDGDVVNHDNSYGAISDQRIKQNIVDANSQWDDIKALKVRNFKKKDDVRQYGEDKAWTEIGLIAQEAELVSPKLVKENPPSVNDVLSDSAFGTLVDDTGSPKYYQDGDTIPSGKKIGDEKLDGSGNVIYNKKVGEEKQKVKSIKYSVLYMKAIKALQEAQTRIETLETKVKTLEDA